MSLVWGSSPVEGQINRLKMIKRTPFAPPSWICCRSGRSRQRNYHQKLHEPVPHQILQRKLPVERRQVGKGSALLTLREKRLPYCVPLAKPLQIVERNVE